jgi:hypothetical protein
VLPAGSKERSRATPSALISRTECGGKRNSDRQEADTLQHIMPLFSVLLFLSPLVCSSLSGLSLSCGVFLF